MESTHQCPKCGFTGTAPFTECPKCGIIVAKFVKSVRARPVRPAEIGETDQRYELAGLAESRRLFMRQQLELAEVWLGIETRNRYLINLNLFEAAEMSTSIGAILSRLFMANWRPFSMKIVNRDGRTALTLERPFRFYFHLSKSCHPTDVPYLP